MKVTGIICEYNPLHLGHSKQIRIIRDIQGPDTGIVCLMSGNYVQRGAPAIINKMHRAEAAVRCGADLVLELPVTVSLSSAEGFAAGGVKILFAFCNSLCFGAETAERTELLSTAQALLSSEFSSALRSQLDKGLSFPAARQAALDNMGVNAGILSSPNNILAVEYCKAILDQNAAMEILPIQRNGSYHDTTPDRENPSATAVRNQIVGKQSWLEYIPAPARRCFAQATVHSLSAGERAVLARLRCINEEDFSALPYGSEGLWRKLMHAVRAEATLEAILAAVKSKRYTRSRLDRMIMCAYLGITQQMLETPAPYVRVLALNDRGREILKAARETGCFPNIGQTQDHPYEAWEKRWGDLYGLFAQGRPDAPNAESKYRVYYHE